MSLVQAFLGKWQSRPFCVEDTGALGSRISKLSLNRALVGQGPRFLLSRQRLTCSWEQSGGDGYEHGHDDKPHPCHIRFSVNA